MVNLSHYNSIIFDCDGVILNSNTVKSDSFYSSALPFGEKAADLFLRYHLENGGVSRYVKFRYLISDIAPCMDYSLEEKDSLPNLELLLTSYREKVLEGLMKCELSPNLEKLRSSTPGAKWLVVSGGDEQELRDVFIRRGIAHLFDGGIYGSPDTKGSILERELNSGNIRRPALFIGDSKYDYTSSKEFGIDFVFAKKWSECSYLRDSSYPGEMTIDLLQDLIP